MQIPNSYLEFIIYIYIYIYIYFFFLLLFYFLNCFWGGWEKNARSERGTSERRAGNSFYGGGANTQKNIEKIASIGRKRKNNEGN